MWGDNVLEEVRAIREAHAARFGFDLRAIVEDLRKREGMSGHQVMMPASLPSDAKITSTSQQQPGL